MDESYFQLVRTKLCLPKLRSKIVDRNRLVEQAALEQGMVLTLVSAPAGYGKTTFIVELANRLAHSGTAIAWYALDINDNDPNLFCSYLIAGLGEALNIDDALAPIARSLRSSSEFSIEKILPAIINAVVIKNQKYLLALDDYHLITSPVIHNMILYLLEHLPGNMHVIIGSRSDPPLSLARLRARSKMNEIRLADLRFTWNEASQFLNKKMCLALPPQTITDMVANTEGWITGLQLAAISLASAGQGVISRFGGSSRYLVEYLLQEVIELQSPEIQEFLMSTSVLERLCGPLCDAVLGGESNSGDILNQLEQNNLFIIPLDDENYWFRYHHLFQEFLRNRLKRNHMDQIPLLHRAASEWYSSQHLLGEAVSHAFEMQDLNYAAGIVELHGMKMLMLSEISILQNWCEKFPEEVYRTHPMLCILQGWVLSLSYRKEYRRQVEERVEQALQAASMLSDQQRGNWLTGQAMLVRLSLCLTPDSAIDPKQYIDLANRVLELLPEDDPFCSFAISAIGYAHMSSQNVPVALQTMKEYRSMSLASRNYYGAIAAMFYLACLMLYQGQLKATKEFCLKEKERIASAIINLEQKLPAIGSLDVIIGYILLEENRLDEAENALRHGLELIRGTNNPFYRLMACIALFRLCEIQGRIEEAFQFLDYIESEWPDIAFCTEGLKLRHNIQINPEDQKTLSEAENWCKSFSLFENEEFLLPGMGPFGGAQAYYIAGLLWVQFQIILGKPDKTLYYLEQQRSVAEAQGLLYRLVEISLLEVQARKANGEDRRAIELLGRTLKLAESIGCLRIFDQSMALIYLLEEVTWDISPGYIEQIKKAVGLPAYPAQQKQTEPIGNSMNVGLEALSERELEVLRLIANGDSNQQIADRLVITVGTVKSHINHILSKLDVHNRLEAVVCARNRGLLKI